MVVPEMHRFYLSEPLFLPFGCRWICCEENFVMIDPATLIFFLFFAVLVSFPLLISDKTLGRIMNLRQINPDWDKRFPDVEDRDIFAFLDALVESLGHVGRNRLVSKPTDKIRDVFQALYPPDGAVDASELQAFTNAMKERFGVDLEDLDEPWEIELGNLFAMTQGSDDTEGVSQPPSEL